MQVLTALGQSDAGVRLRCSPRRLRRAGSRPNDKSTGGLSSAVQRGIRATGGRHGRRRGRKPRSRRAAHRARRNGDTTRQNQDVQTLITQGADVVIINANDPIASARRSRRLSAPASRSSPSTRTSTPSWCRTSSATSPSQFADRRQGGKVIAEKALQKWGDDGAIKLASIGGFPGDVISDLRFNGFLDGYNSVMKAHPNVKTTMVPMKFGEWKPDKALGPIRDMATANPDLRIMYSMSDVMQGGIEQGLKGGGVWDKVLEGSYDGGMNAIKEMADNPNGPLQADASNQPWDQLCSPSRWRWRIRKRREGLPVEDQLCRDDRRYAGRRQSFYKPGETYVRAAESN